MKMTKKRKNKQIWEAAKLRQTAKLHQAAKLQTDLNILIDHTFHPLFKKDKRFVIIDGAMHFVVEKNPKKSFKKFIRYSLKHLL